MVAMMLAGHGMVYGGHSTTQRLSEPVTPRRKVNTHPMVTASDAEIRQWNTHPMVTASDAEIRQWNANVKTRQVLRSVIKPWRYPYREWRTML
jgi:hypothetical protein